MRRQSTPSIVAEIVRHRGPRRRPALQAAAVTLLPAVLAAVVGKIPPTAPAADVAGRFYRLTRWVQSHAVAVGAASIAFLVLLGRTIEDSHWRTTQVVGSH